MIRAPNHTTKKQVRRIQVLEDSNSSSPELLYGSAELKFKQKLKSVTEEPLTRRISTRRAMREPGALEVANAFEECVFRLFGAPSLIRYDRDSRLMSEVFQAFVELMQAKSRATLSYKPQARDLQERSVKKMIRTVRSYVEGPRQADWDDIAEKMVDAINNSRDTTWRETPLYLVHDWDAQLTLKAMTSTIKNDPANSADTA
ncbi:unnamed protein product [Phytophthora fragariaefolia]|uniref:Unnamed protein product n=1 Tax=Phytophthora fragariaefolia TaxID=1490495 RepID=A0A9W7CMI9_9STRA|nr:unnamed protein product [Phytophthora fragariaefolia]